MKVLLLFFLVSFIAFPFFLNAQNDLMRVRKFSHPGILLNKHDIRFIQKQISNKKDPWYSSYLNMCSITDTTKAKLSGPYEICERTEGKNSRAASALSSSSQLAFRSAVLWAITGDIRYAEKSKSIINAWSPVLKDLVGGDALLMAAWYGFGLVNAAEILRHTDSGWHKEDVKRAEDMFVNVFYRLIKDWKRGRAGNWDTAITKTMMGIAVFIEDKEMFNRALEFYISTAEKSNGTLMKYIYDSGQCFESARDQNHAQMGLSGLAFACEIAWKQGIDLYSYDNHRLLRGFEYTARYNLGDDNLPKPFVANAYGDTISTISRGQFAPTYEIVLNHYVNRLKYSSDKLPYTSKVVESVRNKRKEGEQGNAIVTGYGTLLYNRNKSYKKF